MVHYPRSGMSDLFGIPGWPGYGAMRAGHIVDLRTGEARAVDPKGRVRVRDADGNQRWVSKTHLVCLAFRGPQPEGMVAAVLDDLSPAPTADTVHWILAPKPRSPELRHAAPVPKKTSGIVVVTASRHAARMHWSKNGSKRACFYDFKACSPHTLEWIGCLEGTKTDLEALQTRFQPHHLHEAWYRLDGLTPWLGERPVEKPPQWEGEPVSRHDFPDCYTDVSSFYIFQLGHTGPIRIGTTKSVLHQLRLHRRANYEPIVVRRMIHAGPGLVEHLGEQWNAHRIRGDWFQATPELAQAVRQLRNRYDC